MDIEILNKKFKVGKEPGLDITDERLSDIPSVVQKGDFIEAANEIEALFKEEIYDVRLLGYYVYGIFFDKGLSCLNKLLNILNKMLSENIDAFGPVKNKEKHIQKSFVWFFDRCEKGLKYQEKLKEDKWDSWCEKLTTDDIDKTTNSIDELKKIIQQVLTDKKITDIIVRSLSKLEDWIKAFSKILKEKQEQEEQEQEEEEEEKKVAHTVIQEQSKETNEQNIEELVVGKSSNANEKITIDAVYPLKILLKKIKIFEDLIEAEKHSNAALVADDINNIISNFDPKVYFPQLFSNFSDLFAINIGKLSSYNSQKNSLEWLAMSELYKVDLDRFVEFAYNEPKKEMTAAGQPGMPPQDYGAPQGYGNPPQQQPPPSPYDQGGGYGPAAGQGGQYGAPGPKY